MPTTDALPHHDMSLVISIIHIFHRIIAGCSFVLGNTGMSSPAQKRARTKRLQSGPFIAQGAHSPSLHKRDGALGVQLFGRGPRGVTLTLGGLAFSAEAKPIASRAGPAARALPLSASRAGCDSGWPARQGLTSSCP